MSAPFPQAAGGSSSHPRSAAPPARLGVRFAVGLLDGYKRWISPLLPRSCRFTPTCSEYARLAFLEHGSTRGSALTLWRLLRCQPFARGGVDLP